MNHPLVSIICICYNHEKFVEEALQSVFAQSYPAIELVVVDDASTDGSVAVIQQYLEGRPKVKSIFLEQNLDHCKAFNRALKLATGQYVIDLAADDVLLPERVAKGVRYFEKVSEKVGVQFTDAAYIDAQSQWLGYHYPRHKNGKRKGTVPEGDVYVPLLEKYFLCPPTMMIRRAVLDDLGGYDESLAYEDFDFWIRSSRKYHYQFLDEVLVHKRLLQSSKSAFQYHPASGQQLSTWQVCQKAWALNQNQRENKALAKRLRYEIRQAIKAKNYAVARKFYDLLKKVAGNSLISRFYGLLLQFFVRCFPS